MAKSLRTEPSLAILRAMADDRGLEIPSDRLELALEMHAKCISSGDRRLHA